MKAWDQPLSSKLTEQLVGDYQLLLNDRLSDSAGYGLYRHTLPGVPAYQAIRQAVAKLDQASQQRLLQKMFTDGEKVTNPRRKVQYLQTTSKHMVALAAQLGLLEPEQTMEELQSFTPYIMAPSKLDRPADAAALQTLVESWYFNTRDGVYAPAPGELNKVLDHIQQQLIDLEQPQPAAATPGNDNEQADPQADPATPAAEDSAIEEAIDPETSAAENDL